MEHSLTADRDTEKQHHQPFDHSRATTINSKFDNLDNHDADIEMPPSTNPPSIFHNIWHEILFIIVVTSAQLITVCQTPINFIYQPANPPPASKPRQHHLPAILHRLRSWGVRPAHKTILVRSLIFLHRGYLRPDHWSTG